ncbi:uncharacterized protein LOC143305818 [Osmia lignaria lignaria]|uniref:uncharacterized protein LOC143305818 n=1 Tax=Osmia lignaria lignaria TaxID=1437193 RepID=UPI00402B6426
MTTLNDIPAVSENIKKALTKQIRALYKFITGTEGDRNNRKYLRSFTGLGFESGSKEFNDKVMWAVTSFDLGELIAICNVLDIDYSGQREEVVRRICEYLADPRRLNTIDEPTVSETEEESEDEAMDDTIRPRSTDTGARPVSDRIRSSVDSLVVREDVMADREMPKFTLNFRDIEDSIRQFNGTDGYPVESWIQDFEENAELLGWSDLQKLLFAKKCLTGLAKLFMQGERGIMTWRKLKSLLLEEFSTKINSAQLHQMLSNRKMRREESVHEYFLVMKEIAARGYIEAEALIQYIVDGIPDEPSRKAQLYEAKRLTELKDKLKIYDRIRNLCRPPIKKVPPVNLEVPSKSTSKTHHQQEETKPPSRCYNCNETGHLYAACPKPKRERGTCYTCGAVGHKKQTCPQRASAAKERASKPPSAATTMHLVQFNTSVVPCYTVDATLDAVGKVDAVLDTGSPVSFLTKTLIKPNVVIRPHNNTVQFGGVKRSKINILRRLKQIISVADCEIEVDFYVIPENTMSCTCLLGRDFITNDNIEITLGKTVRIQRKLKTGNDNYPVSGILKIDAIEDDPPKNIKIDEKVDWESRNKIENIMNECYVEPERPESPVTKLEMELVLKPNHQPFYYATTAADRHERKILIYLDDILIATKTISENLEILKQVLTIVVKNRLELKLEKCAFLLREIIYLGYCIDSSGVRPSKENIQAVCDYPIPRNYRELQSFLGLVSYFRKFIKNFALRAKPLYDLLKSKVTFKWNDEMLKCFEDLKKLLVSEPVLAIYCPTAETELHCDASTHGFGSVLLQKQADGKFHPICYFSKRTTQAETKYHSFELEALAIVYSLERFRIYLHGIPFKIVTDCNSLKLTLERKEINPKILRWSLIFRNYQYTLEHRPGDRLVHADTLSREFSVLVITENSFERNLAILQGQDPQIKKLRDELQNNENRFFELNNGIVYRKMNNKLLFYVPSSMEDNVIRTNHEEIGHQDRGSAFTSSKYKEFLAENSIQHILVATATPHANGQIERINRSLTPLLAKLSSTTGTWNQVLENAEYALNNSVNRTIGDTPSRLLFGINQLGKVQDDLRVILEEQIIDDRDLNSIRENAVAKIQAANEYNKNYYDKKHKTSTRLDISILDISTILLLRIHYKHVTEMRYEI